MEIAITWLKKEPKLSSTTCGYWLRLSTIGRMISTTAAVSRVLDAETVVVGMQPAVAITLVELGLTLTGVRTAMDVDRGLALLKRTAGPESEDSVGPDSPGRADEQLDD